MAGGEPIEMFTGESSRDRPMCPVCKLRTDQLFCSNCVRRGSFCHKDKLSDEDATYPNKIGKITMTKNKIQILFSEINGLLQSSKEQQDMEMQLDEKRLVISDLKNAIAIKRSIVMQKRSELQSCKKATNLLAHKSFDLKSNDIREKGRSLGKSRKKIANELTSAEERLAYKRATFSHDLLNYFPIQISSESSSLGTICEAALHTNKDNIFAGPEPVSSSQTALQYLVLATRCMALVHDIAMPCAAKRVLSHPRNFIGEHILRDDLSRVYSMLCRCLEIMSASVGSTPAAGDPLTTLFHLIRHRVTRPRPYQLPVKSSHNIFDTGEVDDGGPESWNTPLCSSLCGGQDWVEVSGDVPTDTAIQSYELSASTAYSAISLASSLWNWKWPSTTQPPP